jgi:ER membrane protein complex subunit 6
LNFARIFNVFDFPALAGCTAGILGLTGLLGFFFYLVSLLGFFGLLIVKTGSNSEKYFISRKSLLTNGFLGGLCTYTLFWTFIYGMVHVY